MKKLIVDDSIITYFNDTVSNMDFKPTCLFVSRKVYKYMKKNQFLESVKYNGEVVPLIKVPYNLRHRLSGIRIKVSFMCIDIKYWFRSLLKTKQK